MKDKVIQIINSIERLPPFPLVALKVIAMARDEKVSFNEIAKVVQYDPGISANVLKWCNSAYFGLRRKVSSIQQALVYLGAKNLIEIVMMSSCKPYLDKEISGYQLEKGELWYHSVACAVLSQILADKANYNGDKTVLFTGGLLHDIGKIVLSEYLQKAISKIKDLIEKGMDFLSAEKTVLGIHHAELGAEIADKWNFPQELVNIIRYHHEPQLIEDKAAAIVHLADVGVLMLGIGGGLYGLAYRAENIAYERLGLKEKDLMEAMAELGSQLNKIEDLIKR